MAATSHPNLRTEEQAHPFGILYRLVETEDRVAPMIARLALALVIFPHGAQKLLGWFGGGGLTATVSSFGQQYHVPNVIAIVVTFAEFFGAIGLLFGLLGRIAAFGIACVMVGAIALVSSHVGFFMNWSGGQAGEGVEYHLAVIGLALVVMIAGSGKASVDRALTPRSRSFGGRLVP
jgi:putative oxidoreductase